jgi:type IV pilus assembly protein PilC
MKFHFKAQKATGEVYESDREAPDKFVLYRDLKKAGDTVLSAVLDNQAGRFNFGQFLKNFSFGGIGTHDKIIFARNLGAMIQAGLPLSRALAVLERQVTSQKLKKILAEINEKVGTGRAFSEILKDWPGVFSPLFVSMVRSGEEGGNLARALSMVASQMDRNFFIQRKIKGAMVYPAIVISLIFAVGSLMLIFVVPKLTSTFKEFHTTLPRSTRLIISVSDFLEAHYVWFFVIVLALAAGFYFLMKSGPGKRLFDFGILHTPILRTMVQETNSARAARTMASLLSAGVNVITALEISGQVVQNSYYREVLNLAAKNIEKGETLSKAFTAREDLYPAFFGEMISAGEETGNLSGMLSDVGDFYENEVDQKTKDLSTVIEPLIMIVIGAAVGFFAFSMITPIYSLTSSI